MGFPREEHWSGYPFPSPGDLLNPGIEHASPAMPGGFFTTEPPGKPRVNLYVSVLPGNQQSTMIIVHIRKNCWQCHTSKWIAEGGISDFLLIEENEVTFTFTSKLLLVTRWMQTNEGPTCNCWFNTWIHLSRLTIFKNIYILKNIYFYSLIWLCWVLVTAHGVFSCGMWTLSFSMWGLIPWPGIEPGSPVLGAWSLSHQNTRKVPRLTVFYLNAPLSLYLSFPAPSSNTFLFPFPFSVSSNIENFS